MKKNQFHSTYDFVSLAKRKLPKFVFDFIDGGAGEEDALRSNVNSFSKIKLIPFVKHSSVRTTLDSQILGNKYSAPFGVAPLGLCGLVHPAAEILVAKVAAKYNIPYVISSASNCAISSVLKETGVPPWFQLYIPKVEVHLNGLLERAEANGCPVLVLTVDTPVPGRRLRDLSNGLSLPYKLNYRNIVEALSHPMWAKNRLLAGKIQFPNFGDFSELDPDLTFRELMDLQTGGNLDWNLIRKIRHRWKGKMVLKGVLSSVDGLLAKSMGVDAVIISNHGGRQLNSAPAPISLVPTFVACGLDKEFLMLDGGIRSGENIVSTLASGVDFVFIGRLCLYALAANGEKGVESLFNILFSELKLCLELLGVGSPKDLSAKHLCIV